MDGLVDEVSNLDAYTPPAVPQPLLVLPHFADRLAVRDLLDAGHPLSNVCDFVPTGRLRWRINP